MFLRRFAAVALIALGFTAAAQETSVVENTPAYSKNGRFAAIVRWRDVPDFESGIEPPVFHPDDEEMPLRETVPLALYDVQTRRKLAEVTLSWDETGDALVSDTGRFIVVLRELYHGCIGVAGEDERLVTIFRSDGSRVGALKVGDVISDWDLMNHPHIEAELRYAASSGAEVLGVTVDGDERRIDLATAKLLDEKRDVHPRPRPYTTDLGGAVPRKDYQPSPDFDDKGAIPVVSNELFAHLWPHDEPTYPKFALHARISGSVVVQVVVDEYGAVRSVRTTPLPLGLADTAAAAAKEWRFQPFSVNGHRVRVTGELVVHFPWTPTQ